MCGIIGLLSRGTESVVPRLVKGLEVLENRGYDSTGIAVLNGHIHAHKRQGKLANLVASLDPTIVGSVGIAHTRWATHGKPTDTNAHPHLSEDGTVAVAHNGIIENYHELRALLQQEGCTFQSDTDTEVIPNLIARAFRQGATSLLEAVKRVLPLLKGEYAILVLSQSHPNQLVAAVHERPLLVGRGSHGLSIASAEVALVGHADEVSRLDEKVGELVFIGPKDEIVAYQRDEFGLWQTVEKQFRPISITEEDVSKGNFGTFMEKEIREQPDAVKRALLGRLVDGYVYLPELDTTTNNLLRTAPLIVATACGTSRYALEAAKLLFERVAGVPMIVEAASEFQDREEDFLDRDPLIGPHNLVIAVSQSGETADTVGALNYALKKGAHTLAITNAKASQLANAAHADVSVQAGPERAVASTKAYTAQVVTLMLLAIHTGTLRGTLSDERRIELIDALRALSGQVAQALGLGDRVQEAAAAYKHAERIMIIGKGFAVPVALEAALKIQEIDYIDAAGFASGELKHGPLALVTDGVPVVVIALNGTASHRTLSNAQEVLARGGDLIAIVTEGSDEEDKLGTTAKYLFALPQAPQEMTPILSAIIVQLLALYLGVIRGNDVDQPRNLAKSVTVK